jgi:hypothetical protein
VYDLNGGSSDEVAAVLAGAGADRPLGPDKNSGTNNTIRTTRMIAPVSRSFTRTSKMGMNPPQCKRRAVREPVTRQVLCHSVYAKPLQCRPHRVDGAKDQHPVTRNCGSLCDLTTLFDGCCERNLVGWQMSSRGQIRR